MADIVYHSKMGFIFASIAESQPDIFRVPPKDEVMRLRQLYAGIKRGTTDD